MADTIPPDTRAAGQTGHLGDHNNIADVLADHEALLTALPVMTWGIVTLVAGTATVGAPAAVSTSKIIVSHMTPGGTLGTLSVPTITSGTSFVINSTSASDTSIVAYLILNP